MSVKQSGNKAGGDIVGGDKVIYHSAAQPTSLSRLYEILREADQAAPYMSQIADQLLHWSKTTSVDIRSLKEKLTASGRTDLVAYAEGLKERAAKLIMRWQTSPITQDIITHILSKIHTQFMFYVVPAIQSGKDRQEVDALVMSQVIAPTYEMLGDNDLGITDMDIAALLFFLGGNCHVRWDKC